MGVGALAVAVALAVSACGGESAPTRVSVADACSPDHRGHRIVVEGFLRLPEKLALSDTAVIELYSLMGGDGDHVPLRIGVGDGPDQLRDLPDTYSASSLRVGVQNDERTASIIDRVVVTAKATEEDGACLLVDPAIERAADG